MGCNIILASASPRRSELLKQVGVTFAVSVAEIDETRFENESPSVLVSRLSREKALAVSVSNEIVIAADTVVALGDNVLGKPQNSEDAVRMLQELSGKSHTVYTGFSVLQGNKLVTDVVATEVVFRDLASEEIFRYVANGEPMDKAGAYGIQGEAAAFVSEIHGDYYNVVGLPLCRLISVLTEEFNWKRN